MLVTFVDDVFVRLTLRESFLERSIPRTSKGLPEPCVCSVLIDKTVICVLLTLFHVLFMKRLRNISSLNVNIRSYFLNIFCWMSSKGLDNKQSLCISSPRVIWFLLVFHLDYEGIKCCRKDLHNPLEKIVPKAWTTTEHIFLFKRDRCSWPFIDCIDHL